MTDTSKLLAAGTVEQWLRQNILFIGNEIPTSMETDPRDKFILLGTPQELIDASETRIRELEARIAAKDEALRLCVTVFSCCAPTYTEMAREALKK